VAALDLIGTYTHGDPAISRFGYPNCGSWASAVAAPFGSVHDGRRIHLDQQVRVGEPSHLDGRAGRRLLAEHLRADVDVLEEPVDVGDEAGPSTAAQLK